MGGAVVVLVTLRALGSRRDLGALLVEQGKVERRNTLARYVTGARVRLRGYQSRSNKSNGPTLSTHQEDKRG